MDCELIGYGLIKQLHALPDGFITRMATAHNAQRIPSRNEPADDLYNLSCENFVTDRFFPPIALYVLSVHILALNIGILGCHY